MDYDEARRRMEEWQRKQRRHLTWWQRFNWVIFTINVWYTTVDILQESWWMAGIGAVAVGFTASVIYDTDKSLKQKFFERE